MIKSNENQFSVILMCRLLSVSRSCCYTYRQRPLSERDEANPFLAIEIKRVFDDEKGQLGAPRIARRLHDEGKTAGLQRVARIMHNKGWWAKASRKYKATNNKHSLPVAPNLFEQDFSADRHNQSRFGYHLHLDGRGLALFGGRV
jgi:putative transposase